MESNLKLFASFRVLMNDCGGMGVVFGNSVATKPVTFSLTWPSVCEHICPMASRVGPVDRSKSMITATLMKLFLPTQFPSTSPKGQNIHVW